MAGLIDADDQKSNLAARDPVFAVGSANANENEVVG
jgi:hypothetical protein